MRILYVTDALAVWGGIERVLSDKMNYLVRVLGYEVYIVTANQGNHPIPYPLDERVHVEDFNIRYQDQYKYHGLRRIKQFRYYGTLLKQRMKSSIERIKPDAISCIRDGFACTVLDVHGSIPVIFESHAMYKDITFEKSTLLHRIITYMNRRKFKNLSCLVALTSGDAKDWKKVCNNTCVIPNVVHLNETGKYSSCDNKKAIFVGRFDAQKDFGMMVKIWEIVQTHHPEWQLEVYGNGDLKPFYVEEVRSKKLNININPAVVNIFEKYIDSSMLLMTSFYEPFGLVLPEAMSCGIPVVAFNCPYGPADIINHGHDGFLVDLGNVDDYANYVCRLMENEAMRKDMGQTAIFSSERYRADVVMPQWKNLFEKLMERK